MVLLKLEKQLLIGNAARRKQLLELVSLHNFDCICLQETIKASFRQRELERFADQRDMYWGWLPCIGHSSGMLMGVDKEVAQVIEEDHGVYFQSMKLTMKADGFEWLLFNIYGLAHDERKREFLKEIQLKIRSSFDYWR